MKRILQAMMVAILTGSLFVCTSCSNDDNAVTPQSGKDIVVPDYQVVLDFFKDLNGMPRPSKHEEKIRQYLTDFAKARSLECSEHDGNILIRKPATKGMEDVPSVVLQTHMDMVCVAADGFQIDFLTEGIEPETSGGYIHSKGFKTTLGADDGIGMSIALGILDSKEIVHGPLECLFTWDEEDSMTGALSLKPGVLKSKYMMNLDSEEDGYQLVGTAGLVDVKSRKTYTLEPAPAGYVPCQISVKGLAGGHSGDMIYKGGANANKLIADFLANEHMDCRLVSFEGGKVTNAITESATATVLVPSADTETFLSDFNTCMNEAKEKYKGVDVNMNWEGLPLQDSDRCIPQAAADLLVNGISHHRRVSWNGAMCWRTCLRYPTISVSCSRKRTNGSSGNCRVVSTTPRSMLPPARLPIASREPRWNYLLASLPGRPMSTVP